MSPAWTHSRTATLAQGHNKCGKSVGSKELSIFDNEVTKQAKIRHKNLAKAWIDYRKNYDASAHSWLIEVFRKYRVNSLLIELLRVLITSWRKALTLGKSVFSYETAEIRIGTGNFQGDGVIPQWVCLALNDLSGVLNSIDKSTRNNSSAYEYSITEQGSLTHLFHQLGLHCRLVVWHSLAI